MKNVQIPPAVNFHLWEPCNMRCKYCFATFQDVKQTVLPKGHLPQEKAIQVVKQLADVGFQKITFAGGEPTICPWLYELIETAHLASLTTMIVTNGTQLSAAWLEKFQPVLDWVTLSVDSLLTDTNLQTGRAITGKKVLSLEQYMQIVSAVKKANIRLKINTVVSAANWEEDMSSFIQFAKPERWKLFQVLPILGQNDACIQDFTISNEQFYSFVEKHQTYLPQTKIVAESNDLMTASYAMLDPAGRFFDNSTGTYIYSEPILEVGVKEAFQFVSFSEDKFNKREGLYNW